MIRKFVQNDRVRVMEIWLSANLDAHGFIRAEYWHDCENEAAAKIENSEVYVAENDGEIIGFIGLDNGFIEGIFVDGEHRSDGVGKELIDYAKGLYPRLTLCVYEKNADAERFYLREGFTTVRTTLDVSTGENELFMKWEARKIKFDLGDGNEK